MLDFFTVSLWQQLLPNDLYARVMFVSTQSILISCVPQNGSVFFSFFFFLHEACLFICAVSLRYKHGFASAALRLCSPVKLQPCLHPCAFVCTSLPFERGLQAFPTCAVLPNPKLTYHFLERLKLSGPPATTSPTLPDRSNWRSPLMWFTACQILIATQNCTASHDGALLLYIRHSD